MQNLITWLFTDPVTAGLNTPSGKPEVFHFYWEWILVSALMLLIPFYYWMEGRKRFFGHHALNKYLLDKFTNQLWPIGLVGFALIGARYAEMAVFSWRVWRYGWALWAVAIGLYWLYYLSFRYARDLNWYRNQRTKERYMPKPKAKRSPARAGAR
ncbi:MAG TPA: hypothetical protein VMV29_13535 [Ktedonobacterales bacterium]|nr:hypothetical protein [Ktedonobacterales bacterium]